MIQTVNDSIERTHRLTGPHVGAALAAGLV